jgi:hypothetical protein
MPLSYSVDRAGACLLVVASGVVAIDDLAHHITACAEDPAARDCDLALFDLRQAKAAIGYSDLVMFRDFLGHALQTGPQRRWALLVCSDVSYGLARMFVTLSEDLPLSIDIFEDQATALSWLLDRDPQSSDRLETVG